MCPRCRLSWHLDTGTEGRADLRYRFNWHCLAVCFHSAARAKEKRQVPPNAFMTSAKALRSVSCSDSSILRLASPGAFPPRKRGPERHSTIAHFETRAKD